MNELLQKLEVKIENQGATPQGRVSAAEWNVLVSAVKDMDLKGIDTSALAEYLTQYQYVTAPMLEELLSGALPDYDNVVTIESEQTIIGLKNFSNGLKVGGALITYDATKNTLIFPCNAVFERGIAWNSSINGFEPQTITEAVKVDGVTIGRDGNGALCVIGGSGGGGTADSVAWSNITGKPTWIEATKPTYTWSEISSRPTALSQFTNDVGYITSAAIPTKISAFTNDSGYITGVTSSMVTTALGYTPFNASNFTKANIKSTLGISDWALATSKPSYAYSEISGTPSSLPASDVYAWAKAPTKPSYTAAEVGALPVSGGTLNGPLAVAGTTYATSVICGTESLRVNAADNDGNFGYLRVETVGSNRGMLHIGANYGGSTSITNTSVRVDAIGLYRGVVGIGGTFTYDQLYSNYSNGIKLYVNGNVVSTGTVAWNSSRALKNIVGGAPTYLTLAELRKIRPYRYTWKDGRDNRIHAGGIADEVLEVLPEVIMTDAKGIHSMDYGQVAFTVASSLTPYVSKHEREIKALRLKVKVLERTIEKLTA